jgi:hypothetical protein
LETAPVNSEQTVPCGLLAAWSEVRLPFGPRGCQRGMAVFAPLIVGGLTCQRGRSRDAYRHVEYRIVGQPPQRGVVQ